MDRGLLAKITGHEANTVPGAGWASFKNGELLAAQSAPEATPSAPVAGASRDATPVKNKTQTNGYWLARYAFKAMPESEGPVHGPAVDNAHLPAAYCRVAIGKAYH